MANSKHIAKHMLHDLADHGAGKREAMDTLEANIAKADKRRAAELEAGKKQLAERIASYERQLVQAVLPHQLRAHAREIALGLPGQRLEQHVGHGQAQHGVAQKLQPLVVVAGETAVGQRPLEQADVGEHVVQPGLQFIERGRSGHALGPRLRRCVQL